MRIRALNQGLQDQLEYTRLRESLLGCKSMACNRYQDGEHGYCRIVDPGRWMSTNYSTFGEVSVGT